MSLTRRNLIQLGAAATGLLSSKPSKAFTQFFRSANPRFAGAQQMITACGICSPNCGITATVKDGVLDFAEGLADDFSGAGHLCGKGAAAAGFVYDPDRLKYPMKRTNPIKGFDVDPGFVRISWQEALDTIAARLKTTVEKYGPESLLFVTLPSPDLWVRLMNSLGVVNRVDHIDVCFQSDNIIQKYTTGGKTWCNDFENSKYILLFGWDIVAKSKLVYATTVVKARENGAKVVHFSPTYTTTSKMANEWFPIRPGSDLAVALAMINVIVSENLYNQEFVNSYTNFAQFEGDIRKHFAEFTPEWAEKLSDVPAAAITRIAREFAAAKAGIVPAHKKTLCANYSNASQLVHAVSILNILAGTIDRPGGRYFPRAQAVPGVDAIYPPPKYPAKVGRRVDGRDKLTFVHEIDNGLFSTLSDGMLKQNPGLIKLAFWNGYTILGFPNPKKMEEAMKAVDFTVVVDVIPTDTVSMADIVLPSATYLEVSDIVPRVYNARYQQTVVRQPVVAPMFESRPMGYIALELGKRVAPDFFKKSDGTFINTAELLDEKTKRMGLGETFNDFKQTGFYNNPQPFVPRTSFAVPDSNGKCQIYVPQFGARGAEALPKWHPKRDEPSAEYPYYYQTFIPAIHKRNSTENNMILNEIMPTNTANLNSKLAARLGIQEGDTVRVWSRAGEIKLPAHLTETIREDCVQVAHGFGHRSRLLGTAGGKGVRDGDVVPESSADEMVRLGNYAGASCIMDAVVNIEKA